MELQEIIIQKIKNEGPVSFRDYMEMALYYPELGYYTGLKDKIGVNGDFYTSSNLTPAFGAMIARQIEQMWHLLGRKPFTIVEYGAGTGCLCHDMMDYLESNHALYADLHYCIIEKSPAMREKEKTHLKDKVSWHQSIREIPDLNGCILSNEVIDNFAVHKMVMDNELMEVYVDYQDGFMEILKPASPALKEYLSEQGIRLPQGFCTEINMEAIEWIKEISSALNTGYVLTIDYGYLSSELYQEHKSGGTLLCYNKHHVNDQYYQDIGYQDITSHVNFSALQHWGRKQGLEYCGFTNQANFLLALGFAEYLAKTPASGQNIMEIAQKTAFINNTLLIDMGYKFKVLIQAKGAPCDDLSGLKEYNKIGMANIV